MSNPITIVGGGLAGLTLGIGLRQHGVPAVVWEAGHYPRHRVCGEFISGHGQEVLSRMGLIPLLQAAGGRLAHNAAFFDSGCEVLPRPLPRPAFCISRHVLDHRLATEFERLGGELRTGVRWRGVDGLGVAHASGRRVEPVVGGYRWIGLKAHAKNVALAADIELHFLPNGYVGLCQLAGGIVNACGLFRSRLAIPDLSNRWRAWLAGPEASLLHERLATARFDAATFCAVAGLDTRPRMAKAADCRIGDALTMIAPMTGNGMSMALESAELATPSLVEFSQGRLSWSEAKAQISRACNARFRRRLHCAAWLQELLFYPRLRRGVMQVVAHSEPAGNLLFKLTR